MSLFRNILFIMGVVLLFGTNAQCAPDCTATGDLTDVCEGTSGLSASVPTGPSGTTYLWSISANGTISGATNLPTVNYSADSPGLLTLSIQVTDPAMDQCSENYNLNVFSNPVVDILVEGSSTSSYTVCSGETISLNGNPSGGSGGFNHSWTGDVGPLGGNVNAQQPDFYTTSSGVYSLVYTVIDSAGCSDSDTVTITVNESPTASIVNTSGTPGDYWLCLNESLSLDGSPAGGAGGYSHAWTGDTGPLDNVLSQTPVFQTSAAGEYTLIYTVTDSNNCSGTDTIVVHVENPVVDIRVNSQAVSTFDACAGVTVSLNGNPTGGSGSNNHLWSGDIGPLGGSINSQTPDFLTSSPGVYNLTYTVTDSEGCSDNDSITITVHQNPTCDVLINSTALNTFDVCANIPVNLNGNPSGGSGIFSHLWTGDVSPLGGNINSQTPVFNTGSAGTYDLTYTTTDSLGCISSDSITIYVHESPTANIINSTGSATDYWLCLGELITLDGSPNGGSGGYIHAWSGDTGPLGSTSSQTPTFQTSTPGDYFLTYTVTDSYGCIGDDSVTIHVENPTADIEADGAVASVFEVCAGIAVDLDGNPSGGSGSYSHLWTGDTSPLDSTTSRYPEFRTGTDGVYNLTYTVTDGDTCIASDSIEITVHPNPSVEITMAGQPVETEWLCINESLNLSGNPTGGSGSYSEHYWSGSGYIHLNDRYIESPVFQSDTPGVYTLRYRVTDSHGCIDLDVVTISVADPIPDLEANGIPSDTITVCAGNGLILNGNPKDGSRVYVTHQWTGDTSTLDRTDIQSPIFNTSATGTYSLTYTVIDDEGCIGSDAISVTVVPIPIANAGSDAGIVFGDSTVLDGTGSTCAGECTYQWTVTSGDFNSIDDGADTELCTVSPEGPTVYELTVTDSAGCTDSDTVVVTVGYVPIPTLSSLGIGIILCILGFILYRSRASRLHIAGALILVCSLTFIPVGLSQTTHFVDSNSISSAAPYTSWDTASVSIQSAINSAANGDTVLVANGTYIGNITVNKDIRLMSWCLEPDDCVIIGISPAIPAITLLEQDFSNYPLEVAGFKVEGGSYALKLDNNSSTSDMTIIRNCVFSDYTGTAVTVYNAKVGIDFCTFDNNGIGLSLVDSHYTCRVHYNIISSQTSYGLYIDTSQLQIRNNCYYNNTENWFGSQEAYCDEWSASVSGGIDPQFMPGSYRLAPTSPCVNFVQPSGHTECNDILFDVNETPFDLGAYGGYGSYPLPPYIDELSLTPAPGDYRIAQNGDIEFSVWDEGTAGLDANSITVFISGHGSPLETFTVPDLILDPLSEHGTPPSDCRAQGYHVTVPGGLHSPYIDFANVDVGVSVSDRNPDPSSFSHSWDFYADDVNPPVILPGYYPGSGATNVPVYGPIEIDIFDAGVGYDPDSIVFSLNGYPISMNLSDVTWSGDHLAIIPRPRFEEGQSNVLTIEMADFYGNAMPIQTIPFTCAADTDRPFVPGVTSPPSSPISPVIAPDPVPAVNSSDASEDDPITFSLQDFSSVINLTNLHVAISTGSRTYHYYFEPHGGSSYVFNVSGDPMSRRIECYPPVSWPIGSTLTVNISGGTDTASTPNTMLTAVYSLQIGTAPLPAMQGLGLLFTLLAVGILIFIRRR